MFTSPKTLASPMILVIQLTKIWLNNQITYRLTIKIKCKVKATLFQVEKIFNILMLLVLMK